jgi:hypothetical protein
MRLRMPVLTAFLLATASMPANAQSFAVDRGSVLVGGSAGFTSSATEVNGQGGGDRLTSFSLTPELLFFLAPGLAIGGELTFARTSQGDDSFTAYGIGPAATYFFGATEERPWYPYAGASVQLLWESSGADDDPTSRAYRAAVGGLFMLSSAVGLNAELFYRLSTRENDAFEVDTDTFGLAFGISAFVF